MTKETLLPSKSQPVNTLRLLDKKNFQNVKTLTKNDVPDISGIYAIRIKNIDMFPKEFRDELANRNETLLYIGKATRSLRKRLWAEELQGQRPATFFRDIGAVLGFYPPKGSLTGKKNRYNYRFSSDNNQQIILWIKNNLLVNFVECKDNIDEIEKNIINKNKPIMNILNNPQPFEPLRILRKKCKDIANS